MMKFKTVKLLGTSNKWVAEAWGKQVTTKGHGTEPSNDWKHWALAKIVILRLTGLVQSRKIAYEAKGYKDPFHKKCLETIEKQLKRMEMKPAVLVYTAILEIETYIRVVLPAAPNKMTEDVLDILNFCKKTTSKIHG